MSNSQELAEIKLSLNDYQSELSAIDDEAIRERESILNAIQAEEAEIKSLLDKYRQIKRQKELDSVKSSYENLSSFKQTLLSKIQSETGAGKNKQLSSPEVQNQLQNSRHFEVEEGEPKKSSNQLKQPLEVNQKVKIIELIQLIEGMNHHDLVKYYPADIAALVPGFEVGNTVVKNGLLKYYQKHNINIYNALLKLYQKPELKQAVEDKDIQSMSSKDKKYYNFVLTSYPKALPFFWFLVDREPNSIRYVVMEFTVDHIIKTNTVDGVNLPELTLKLPELLEMNNGASLGDFLKDIFLCFHPRRVSQKSNSKNKYFDYVNNIIKTQSTLEDSEVLQLWNYLLKSGYNQVSSPDFSVYKTVESNQTEQDTDLITLSPENLL